MSEFHEQLNISGFPKRLRLLLAHKAIDAGMKLNRYIMHIGWEDVKNLHERLRKLNMSLSPEPEGQWSVSDCRVGYFGKTIEEAIMKAEKERK